MKPDIFIIGILLLTAVLLVLVTLLVRSNRKLRQEQAQAQQAIQALSEAEGRYLAIFENIDALSIQGYRPDGTVVY